MSPPAMRRRLAAGRSVVIDATNIKGQNRLVSAAIVPPDIPVEYVVIDWPLDEKVATAGWRASKTGLIENHAQTFEAEFTQILRGDDPPNVKVVDVRTFRAAAAD